EHFAVRSVLTAAYASTVATPDTTVGLQVSMTGLDAATIDTISSQDQANDTLLAFVNGEIMSIGTVTPLGGGVYKLFPLRARFNTSQQNHAIGDEVWLIRRDQLKALTNTSFVAALTRYFKLQPKTLRATVDLSLCSAINYSFTGNGLGAVAGLALTTAASLQTDGSILAKVFASWTAFTDPEVALYEVGIQPAGGTWDNKTVSSNTADWVVLPNVVYSVRVRAISIYGERFPWSTTATITSAKDTTAPGVCTGLAAVGALRVIQVSWTNPTDTDLNYIEVWESSTNNISAAALIAKVYTTSFARAGLSPGVTRYYWVRAVDTSGNIGTYSSGTTAGVAGTTQLTGTSDLDTYAVQSQNIAPGAITGIASAGANDTGGGQLKTISVALTTSGGTVLLWGNLSGKVQGCSSGVSFSINWKVKETGSGTTIYSQSVDYWPTASTHFPNRCIALALGNFTGTKTFEFSAQCSLNWVTSPAVRLDVFVMEMKK
ncbi:MAG: hypothetical protein PHD76_11050, partial [Methylacidiphilales bacterium]|nr:hypothetical protein [Candidatus Methylacidiphilales bacterium]